MAVERTTSHALLSASSAARWLNCSPSAKLNAELPDTANEYAEKGTLAHALAELKLRKYSTVMTNRKYNADLKKLQSDKLYEPEMMANTDLYLDCIKGIVTGYPQGTNPTILIEQRVDYGHVAPGGFGTADCIVIGDEDLHIIDYKNGGTRVPVEDNPQLKLYSLGVLAAYELLYWIERVHLTIVQPNNGGVSSWETTPDALKAWGEQIKAAAQAAFNGEGECVTGDWCKFCKAMVHCTAQRKDFSLFENLLDTPPSDLTPDEIGRLLERINPVADWMTALREYALSQLLKGAPITGWKPVEGKPGNREWTNQDAAFNAIKASGIDEAMLYERKPLTLAAIEKAISKSTFDKIAGSFVRRPAGKPTLAVESDKRPVYVGKKPEDVFEKVEDSLL